MIFQENSSNDDSHGTKSLENLATYEEFEIELYVLRSGLDLQFS